MRVIGEIPHPTLKITIFQLNHRLSVQFEAGLFTQVYKFRTRPGLESASDVRRLLDENFLADVMANMQRMHRSGEGALRRFTPNEEGKEGFEEII